MLNLTITAKNRTAPWTKAAIFLKIKRINQNKRKKKDNLFQQQEE
jgi:hypothetical protein